MANTYLGNGIAIPHGLPKDRDLILRTGIAVLQVPDGLQWNRGETVYLVVAIAARSDEHIGILANLTNCPDRRSRPCNRLAHTDDPMTSSRRSSGTRTARCGARRGAGRFPRLH